MNLRNSWLVWRRLGSLAIGAGLLLAAGPGCSSSPEALSGAIAATPAPTAGSFARPFDAVPSSDGSKFYFTGIGGQGIGVYSVPALGGAAVPLAIGAPFVSPIGIALSSDDKTLFIADPAAGYDPNDPAGSDSLGMIYTLSVVGGVPQPLPGSAGLRPRGIDVGSVAGADLWFTGNLTTGEGAVFTIGPSGGTATPVVSGAPLTDPSGIAVARSGDAYVVNTADSETGLATVFKVSGGVSTPYVSGLQVGYPAGVALSQGETLLLVSGRDGNLGTTVLYTVKLDGSMSLGMANTGVEGNTEAGGLHRARSRNIFSWTDLAAGTAGTVYRIQLN